MTAQPLALTHYQDVISDGDDVLSDIADDTPNDESVLCLQPKGWVRVECDHGSVMWRPMRCRKCEGCWESRRAGHRHRIMLAPGDRSHMLFVTLTSLPGSTWEMLGRKWSSLMVAIRAKYGPTEYVCAKDAGPKTGMKHFHAVLAGPAFIDQEWLSERWKARTGAYVVWVERPHPSGDGWDVDSLAYELAKYCASGERQGGRRMVNYSKGWPKQERCATTVTGKEPTLFWAARTESGLLLEAMQVIVVAWPTREGCTCIHGLCPQDEGNPIPLEVKNGCK